MLDLNCSATMNADHLERLLIERPYLRTHVPERIFTCALIKGFFWYDKETGRPVLPHQLLTKMQGKTLGNTNTGKIIRNVQEHVLPDFKMKNYFHQGKKCRSIEHDGLEPWMKDMLSVSPNERVYIESLKQLKGYQEQAQWRAFKKAAYDAKWGEPIHQMIANHLHAQRIGYFTDLRAKNFDDAWKVALQRNDGGQQLRALHHVYHCPQPFYFDVGSSRIFGTAPQFLAKAVRQVFFRGCYELDLQNCQTAIIAGIFHVDGLQKRMAQTGPIWPDLLSYLGIPRLSWDVAKPAVKEATYSTMYGMQKHSVEYYLDKNLKEDYLEKQNKFTEHPLIEETLDVLSYAKKKIMQDGGMMSAFGWRSYEKQEDINSFLAHVVQSYEISIMSAIYELAEQESEQGNQSFHILLHQHDGVTIMLSPGVTIEDVMGKIQNVVFTKALSYNILTTMTR